MAATTSSALSAPDGDAASPADAATAAASELGGKYRILAELGQGGTASVSLAVARGPSGFNKLVVLKMMKSNMAEERELADMFVNEARLAARLNHPNIVQTNEVFEHEGQPVLVLEYLEGQPLSSVLARARGTQKFTLAMHLRVISDALSGLHYSHELCDFDGSPLGVVHRDVSPPNVFVTFDGQVKIVDFGIAKLAGSQVETATGVIKGKVRYLSPEQVTGEGVDRRADIFAVGIMLWEAATNARMWSGQREATIINNLLNGTAPSARSVNPAVDEELDRIIAKALAPDPNARHATAAELQSELDEYLGRIGTQVRSRDIGKVVSDLFEDVRTATRRTIEAQLSKVASLTDAEYAQTQPIELAPFGATGSRVTAADRGRKRRPWILLVAVAIGAASGGALLYRLQTSEPAPEPRAPGVVVPAAVELRVTVFPASAHVFLDDRLLPSNPFSDELPRDGKPHQLRMEATGYTSTTRELVFDRDHDIVITLDPVAPKAAPVELAPKPKAVSAPKPKRPAKPQCDVPFTVDARGVKRYKPECL